MMDDIPPPTAQAELGVPGYLFAALVRSGLLGFGREGNYPREALDHYKRYRTQWRGDLPARRYPMERLPNPAGLSGGEQPLLTQTELRIAPNVQPPLDSNDDVGWIGHFYLRANPFFFPIPTELGLVGPVPVTLQSILQRRCDGLRVCLCPDPEERLALVTVDGPPGTAGDPFTRAYACAHSVLREISFAADVPLPVAQAFLIGVPSGTLRIQFPKPAKAVSVESLSLSASDEQDIEIQEAKSLYWEATSTNNPFHQFLTYWRIYERVDAARSRWRQANRRRDTKVVEERMPEMWAWRDFVGQTFDKVRQALAAPFRDAVAHADGKRTRPRTPSTASDLSDVATHVPVVRYIARSVIQNLEATLEDTPGGDAS